MKKGTILILALILAITMTACGSDATTTTPSNILETSSASTTSVVNLTEATESESQDYLSNNSYTFTYGSTTIAMNDDAASAVATLGDPKSYTEEESCAFEGLSKTYYFGSFYLETYPDGDIDRVYCVWLVDDTVTTEEGVYIGSTQAQVEKIYGSEWYNGRNAYVIKTDDCILTIIVENSIVNSIQYTAVIQ